MAALLINVPLHGQAPNGTYLLELTPVSGKESYWPQRTIRLVMSTDTVAFTRLLGLTPLDLQLRGFPANACFAVALPDSAFHWAWRARWTPGRADTVRLRLFQSPDAFADLHVALNGDSISGVEISSEGAPSDQDGLVATVRGHRIGDPDVPWCAATRDAYFRTGDSKKDVQKYVIDAFTPHP